MLDIAMHAAIREQTQKVNGTIRVNGRIHRLDENLVLFDAAVLACIVNARKLLVHDASRAHVQMSDLGIAHLAIGKANVTPRRSECRMRTLRPQLVKVGLGCKRNGVSRTVLGQTKAIHNHQ